MPSLTNLHTQLWLYWPSPTNWHSVMPWFTNWHTQWSLHWPSRTIWHSVMPSLTNQQSQWCLHLPSLTNWHLVRPTLTFTGQLTISDAFTNQPTHTHSDAFPDQPTQSVMPSLTFTDQLTLSHAFTDTLSEADADQLVHVGSKVSCFELFGMWVRYFVANPTVEMWNIWLIGFSSPAGLAVTLIIIVSLPNIFIFPFEMK